MKNQALLSLKDKSKKLKCCLLQFLFGALRVKTGLTTGACIFVRNTVKSRKSQKSRSSPRPQPLALRAFYSKTWTFGSSGFLTIFLTEKTSTFGSSGFLTVFLTKIQAPVL